MCMCTYIICVVLAILQKHAYLGDKEFASKNFVSNISAMLSSCVVSKKLVQVKI